MTNFPKILYHGTSLFRWAKIKADGRMRADTAKYFKSDESKSLGYLFFTDNVTDATMYGMSTSIIDMRALEDPELRGLAIQGRDMIVLALRTSPIKDKIELDPDIITHKQNINNWIANGLSRAKEFEKTTWYRVKGDIPIQYVFAYLMSPFDNLDIKTIAMMDSAIVLTDLRETAFAIEKMKAEQNE